MTELADRLYLRLLVVRCQIGDRAALEELVARCQPRLRAYLFKMLAGRENVEDVNQEIWMDVFRDLAALRSPEAFAPWLYRIARNRVFRLLREHRDDVASIDEIDAIHETNGEPDFSPEDAQSVHDAIGELSPAHREVLLLRFIEEMSYEEIAAVVDCELGTVRSRLHNAKRALRQIIEKGDRT